MSSWQERIGLALAAPPSAVPPFDTTELDPMIGQVLDGKYRLEQIRGRGGMGIVYRATHLGTGRVSAVKVMAPAIAGRIEFIERFKREAKAIGMLNHPNIVDVTDFGLTFALGQQVELRDAVLEQLPIALDDLVVAPPLRALLGEVDETGHTRPSISFSIRVSVCTRRASG